MGQALFKFAYVAATLTAMAGWLWLLTKVVFSIV